VCLVSCLIKLVCSTGGSHRLSSYQKINRDQNHNHIAAFDSPKNEGVSLTLHNGWLDSLADLQAMVQWHPAGLWCARNLGRKEEVTYPFNGLDPPHILSDSHRKILLTAIIMTGERGYYVASDPGVDYHEMNNRPGLGKKSNHKHTLLPGMGEKKGQSWSPAAARA